MDFPCPVSPKVYEALQNFDIETLTVCHPNDVRPILPTLVRMSLIKPPDTTLECSESRAHILQVLTGIDHVNSIVALLSIDFNALDTEVEAELVIRQKAGSQYDNIVQAGVALEFERSDSFRRIRIVFNEFTNIFYQLTPDLKQSDLFDNAAYLGDVCDVLCIAIAELPGFFSICDVVETLLRLHHGPNMACWIVANFPHHFREVCTTLIMRGEKQDEESVIGRARSKTLRMLCQMNPSQSLLIRGKCVELCRMPALAIHLSLDHGADADIVGFVSGLLLGSDPAVRAWFALFIRSGQKRKGDSLQQLREELLRQLAAVVQQGQTVENSEATQGSSPAVQMPETSVVMASAFLRLYSALRCIAGIKFLDAEVSAIIQLLTSRPPPTAAGVRFASLSLCMLIACPALISQTEHERKAISWVQWLVKGDTYFKGVSGAGFNEMLLLMAIHFHSNQLSAVCDLVCTTLGMKVQGRSNNMAILKQIFTQEIFTEKVVAAHAVKVPVTEGLHGGMTGFLPVHCIFQLLKNRAFAKNQVPIHVWIYKQLCESGAPLHPVLPGLVEVYVTSILLPPGSKSSDQSFTNEPLDQDQIRAVFKNSVFGTTFDTQNISENLLVGSPSLSSQLLLLYYLLLYEDTRLNNSTAFANSKRQVYSSEFLSELPIKYLLQQAQRDQASYGVIFSSLLRLLATHFPHLALVEDWLDEQTSPETKCIARVRPPISAVAITSSLYAIEKSPEIAAKLLKRLLLRPATEVWPHAELIIGFFRSTLSSKVPQFIQGLFKKVWLHLNTVLPRSLWIMTINSVLNEECCAKENLTQENVGVDPLQALRVDPRIFRIAPALFIILRVLQASLAASRCRLSRHLLEDPFIEKSGHVPTDTEQEELRVALVQMQESVAAQILLEHCLETEKDKGSPEQMLALREVRSLICSFLHQMFISDPTLAKLVHFQGYPRELLPITVTGIPSMHICLDFIPELLSLPNSKQQIFAVDLASHLSVQYAVPKSMSVARLAINTLSTLLTALPSTIRADFFTPILPSLVRMCGAFPPLADDTISFLTILGKVATSHASVECTESNERLRDEVAVTFQTVLKSAVLNTSAY